MHAFFYGSAQGITAPEGRRSVTQFPTIKYVHPATNDACKSWKTHERQPTPITRTTQDQTGGCLEKRSGGAVDVRRYLPTPHFSSW